MRSCTKGGSSLASHPNKQSTRLNTTAPCCNTLLATDWNDLSSTRLARGGEKGVPRASVVAVALLEL